MATLQLAALMRQSFFATGMEQAGMAWRAVPSFNSLFALEKESIINIHIYHTSMSACKISGRSLDGVPIKPLRGLKRRIKNSSGPLVLDVKQQ